MPNKPDRALLMSFYGDDFTGSTDAMEALALNGLKTILFLEPPDSEMLARFPDIDCFGIAGVSRSLHVDDMEAELAPVFKRLMEIGTPIVHYKICSTFDSSRSIGSIGKAIELGKEYFSSRFPVSLVVGAPQLKRYTLFGNHFATAGEVTYRLDRHPTMAYHPITPMSEADLSVHLKEQTALLATTMNILELTGELTDVWERYLRKVDSDTEIMVFDVLDEERLQTIGSILCRTADTGPQFVVGSSGVEYALANHLRNKKQGPRSSSDDKHFYSCTQIFVVSGSCSPVTKNQIEWALSKGFTGVRLPPEFFGFGASGDASYKETLRKILDIISSGGNPVAYSALGPHDPAIEETKAVLNDSGLTTPQFGPEIAKRLGMLARDILKESPVTRFVIAGGDTSGHSTRLLDLYGLEVLKPIAPGGPLCRGYSKDERFDGIEIVLKGGQVGGIDYFQRVLNTK